MIFRAPSAHGRRCLLVKDETSNERLIRRRILQAGLAGAGAWLLGCNTRSSTAVDPSARPYRPQPTGTYFPPQPVVSTAPIAPRPSDGCQRTTAPNIEGPFFKAGAPSREILVDERTPGTRLSLSCRVLGVGCAPIAGARVEMWQADASGAYDNAGYGFRATLASDHEGCVHLQTIIPGRYLNGSRYRPAHIHVKIHAAGRAPLTTQLYFAGDPYNEGDPFIDRSLIMGLGDSAGVKTAAYDFVLG
jgi:hypothetical protein